MHTSDPYQEFSHLKPVSVAVAVEAITEASRTLAEAEERQKRAKSELHEATRLFNEAKYNMEAATHQLTISALARGEQ